MVTPNGSDCRLEFDGRTQVAAQDCRPHELAQDMPGSATGLVVVARRIGGNALSEARESLGLQFYQNALAIHLPAE